MNSSDEEWGVDNLISLVRNCDGLASGDLIGSVIAAADAFAAGAKEHDDMTLVVVRVGCF